MDQTGQQGAVAAQRRPQVPGTTIAMTAPSPDQHGYVEAVIRSEVQARTALALARPRSMDAVRDSLLRECARPGFAEDAEWTQERWDSRKGKMVEITGPSIRLAEAAKRAMTNMVSQVFVVREDDDYRVGRVSVADLETNEADSADIIVHKVMERRRPPKNKDEIRSTRIGSTGETIYICDAPEGEVLMQFNSQASRALRNLILRFVPGDVVDEARAACATTRANTDAQDPDAARKKLADAFSFKLQVRPADLEKYLGHPLAQTTPAELDQLRALYRALADGQATWAEVMASHEAEGAESDPPDPAAAARQKAKEAAAARKASKEAPTGEPVGDAAEATAGEASPEGPGLGL